MTRREAFRQGVDGAVLDLMLLHQPWGFDLEDIAVTTHWWHGSLDPIAPLATVRAGDGNKPKSNSRSTRTKVTPSALSTEPESLPRWQQHPKVLARRILASAREIDDAALHSSHRVEDAARS